MKQITFSQVNIRVEKHDDGGRTLIIQDAVMLPAGPDQVMPLPTDVYLVPLDEESANGLAKELSKGSNIQIAPANALKGLGG